MYPRRVLGEFLQEHRGRNRAAPPSADVRQVRERALEVIFVIVLERHGPHALARGFRRPQHALAHAVVVGEQPHVEVPQGYHHRARQRGRVHQVRAALFARIGQCIRQDQPPLGVGIDHFDGLARHGRHNVARALRPAARHVLHAGNEGRHGDRRLQLRDGSHRPQHGCAAGHVVLHLLHPVGRLDGDPAAVEGHALAHQTQVRRGLPLPRPVPDHDQRGRFGASTRHAQQRSHAEQFHPFRIQNLAFQPILRGHAPRRLRHFVRREQVGRLVHQGPREVLRLGHNPPARHGVF